MKLISLSILLSSLIIGAALSASFWLPQPKAEKDIDKDNIYQITPSGNLVRYNKKTLQMTLCGLSGQRYRCVRFDENP